MRYRAFADELRALCAGKVVLWEATHVLFVLEMPKSWSHRKKLAMDGCWHEQKPDIDNLLKAFLDALHEDDAGVADVRATKIWGYEPAIYTRPIIPIHAECLELEGPKQLAIRPRADLAKLV